MSLAAACKLIVCGSRSKGTAAPPKSESGFLLQNLERTCRSSVNRMGSPREPKCKMLRQLALLSEVPEQALGIALFVCRSALNCSCQQVRLISLKVRLEPMRLRAKILASVVTEWPEGMASSHKAPLPRFRGSS